MKQSQNLLPLFYFTVTRENRQSVMRWWWEVIDNEEIVDYSKKGYKNILNCMKNAKSCGYLVPYLEYKASKVK